MEIEVIQRSSDQDRARIRLAARTTLNDRKSIVHAGTGELTLVMRRRDGVPVISDIRYREREPAA